MPRELCAQEQRDGIVSEQGYRDGPAIGQVDPRMMFVTTVPESSLDCTELAAGNFGMFRSLGISLQQLSSFFGHAG